MRFSRLCIALCILLMGQTFSIVHAADKKPLPPQRIKSLSQLAKMLNHQEPQYLFTNTTGTTPNQTVGANVIMPTDAGASPSNGGLVPASATAGGNTFSTTNVQVDGVDEADIVKTDGEYIYQVNRSRVIVIRAEPQASLQVKTILAFDSQFYPQEMFLAQDKLVVIGSAWRSVAVDKEKDTYPTSTVQALVFDVSNKENITQIRQMEIDGSYISSRRVDDNVYLVARKYPDYYLIAATGGIANPAALTTKKKKVRRKNIALAPAVKDSVRGENFQRLTIPNIFWFPGFTEPNYLVIGAFSINDSTTPAEVTAYLGAGEQIYASAKNLYVSSTSYLANTTASAPALLIRPDNNVTTDLFKFALNNGHVAFSNRGNIPGTILNQYSMDEKDGFFRVATTTGQFGATSQSNNVYVLDANMVLAGKLEKIAPGERIYATRFLGDRCYLVTFKQVDPLFVIDLANPTAPAILGELKVAGFSNYLHPYDATHIIGFGKDVITPANQFIPPTRQTSGILLPPGVTTNGNPFGGQVTAGVKISLFDVSDVNNPLEQYSVTIGDHGTDSPVLYDPKALLFDRAKNLLVLPITVAVIPNRTEQTPIWMYGDTVFNGAYVYDLTVENGFVLRGTISHGVPQGPGGGGITPFFFDWYSSSITRSLFINNDLYTLSDNKVKVNALDTFAEENSLDLPQETAPQPAVDPLPLTAVGVK